MKNQNFIRRLSFTICICLIISTLLIVPANAQSAPKIDIWLNDVLLDDTISLLIDEVTYVKVRPFFSLFGDFSYSWDGSTVTVTTEEDTVEIGIGLPYIIANGRCIYNGDKVLNFVTNESTYIPLRSAAKIFSLYLNWNQNLQSVYLFGSGKILDSGDTHYNQDDLYWLSRIISAESQGEPLEGKLAVGNVVINRVVSNLFPNDIKSVIFDCTYGIQFTPVANQTLYNNPTDESVLAAKICLEGYSLSNSIIYFLNTSIATQFWIVGNRTYEFTINNHTFYS